MRAANDTVAGLQRPATLTISDYMEILICEALECARSARGHVRHDPAKALAMLAHTIEALELLEIEAGKPACLAVNFG